MGWLSLNLLVTSLPPDTIGAAGSFMKVSTLEL
jgi:hypothetical protein